MQMLLSNLPNDILEFIFKFLSGNDKLNLIKTNKKLIYNFKFDNIKIKLDLRYLLIIDNDLSYLTGVQEVNLSCCENITNQGLKYLKGVHTIDLSCCYQLSDQGLRYLTVGVSALLTGDKLNGVHTINLSCCNQITDHRLTIFERSSYN